MSLQQPRSPLRQLRILSAILFIIVLLLAGFAFVYSRNQTDTLVAGDSIGQVLDQPLSDFALVANSGNELHLGDLKGKYTLLTFGYTHCPDVCPTTLLEFRRIKQELGATASNVQFVFVSVDHERDSPPVLDQFVRRFDPTFIGLQGNDEVLQSIQDEFGMTYAIRNNPDSDAGYLVEHTASKYLINPEGRLIRIYSFATDARDIVTELQDLI